MSPESPSHNEQNKHSRGEVAEVPVQALLRALLRANKERKPEVFGDTDDRFVDSLRVIQRSLGLEEDASVIYPGSGVHVGVARVFGREHVVHVDPDPNAYQALTDHGYDAVQSTIEKYTPPQPVDGIVALNSYGVPSEELISRLVKPAGFVVANNHTHWASELAHMDGTLDLVGAVMPDHRFPDAAFVDGSEIPTGATGIDTEYLIIDRGGNIKPGTPENFTLQNDSPRYPDALFVFKRTS